MASECCFSYFQRLVVSLFSPVTYKSVSGSVFSGTTHPVTQCHVPENVNPQHHHWENLKSLKKFVICSWELVMFDIKFVFDCGLLP